MVIDPAFSLGIEEIDAQHAQWIYLIREFRAAAGDELRGQPAIDAAERTLRALIDYTKHHFASEEKFIESHGYPELEQHRACHRELESLVIKMLAEIQAHTTTTTPLKLNLLIPIWLMEHIMKEDKKYAQFIKNKA